MMSLTRWRLGLAYYAEEIAQGREDYYARSAERPGRFVGRGAESLGSRAERLTPSRWSVSSATAPIPATALRSGAAFSAGGLARSRGFALTCHPRYPNSA